MANVGYASLTVIPSFRGFQSSLTRGTAPMLSSTATSGGRTFGQRFAQSAASPIKTGLRSAFLAVAGIGAVTLGAKFLGSSIEQASDLAETGSKVEQIFGKRARKALERFADSAAEGLGQSKQSALDAAATFGVFGKSAGLQGGKLAKFSTRLTTLASDMASFSNTTPEEAIEAIGSALRGESEPIRKYGVLLDDATLRQEALRLGIIDNVKTALTPQQKVLAAQAAIFEQTSDAQGDFSRTSDGLANQQRILSARFDNLKTKVGTVLLPVVSGFVRFLNREAVPAFGTFIDILTGKNVGPGQLESKVGKIATFIRDEALPALGDFAGFIKDTVIPAVGDLADGIRDRLNPPIRKLVGWTRDDLGPALRALAEDILPQLKTLAKQTSDSFNDLADAFKTTDRKSDGASTSIADVAWALGLIAKIGLTNMALNIRLVGDAIKYGTIGPRVLARLLIRLADVAIPKFKDAWNGLKDLANPFDDLKLPGLPNLNPKDLFRAGGGPVSAGRGYIVGENGPEWFQPRSSGTVLNQQQVAATATTGTTGGFSVTIPVTTGGDPLEAARMAAREFKNLAWTSGWVPA